MLQTYRNQSIVTYCKSIDWLRYDGNKFALNDLLKKTYKQIQILVAECQDFAMARYSSNCFGWKQGLTFFIGQTKIIYD